MDEDGNVPNSLSLGIPATNGDEHAQQDNQCGRFTVLPSPRPVSQGDSEPVKKKVTFPVGQALIKGFAHAPNPWYNGELVSVGDCRLKSTP